MSMPIVRKVRTQVIRPSITSSQGTAVYNGGPLWMTGFKWVNVFWGTYWNDSNLPFTVQQVNDATKSIGTDPSYWGGLTEYGVGYGTFLSSIIITTNPPTTIDDSQIGPQIASWVKTGLVPDVNAQGAYNIFFPPGTTITLECARSCSNFCDYHFAYNDGTKEYYYTVEPYPCQFGCNQCSASPLDTLTEGLSEEMVELATDMQPGTGWIISVGTVNEELCDYCDSTYICNKLTSGVYVNAWHSNKYNACWNATNWPPAPVPPPSNCPTAKLFTATYNTFAKLLKRKTRLQAVVPCR